MREWMTQDDLCEYLQAQPTKIIKLMKTNSIPFHSNLGEPRFFKKEIDEWMLSDKFEKEGSEEMDETYFYRGKQIKEYVLTASKVIIGKTGWNRVPFFLRNTAGLFKSIDRKYLLRKEFEPIMNNFYDYLRVLCQLGLIDNIRQGRPTHYFPNDKLIGLKADATDNEIKSLIKSCIFDIVKQRKEETPQQRHAILLLWYILKIKQNGIKPVESHFNKGFESNSFPLIRLNFTKGLCNFLFNGDRNNELKFLRKWEILL